MSGGRKIMDLFRYSLAEAINQIEWEAWRSLSELPHKELQSWICGDWIVCYFPVSFSPILLERSIQTFKQHK